LFPKRCVCSIVSVPVSGVCRVLWGLFFHSLIWETVDLNQMEEFRREFARRQPIASYALVFRPSV
jgi:hypothetical protein